MRRGEFSLSNLPAWCTFNSITFDSVSVANIKDRGLGLIAEKDITHDDDDDNNNIDTSALLTVPKELILSAAGVEDYAKESRDFRQLLDAAGHQVKFLNSYFTSRLES